MAIFKDFRSSLGGAPALHAFIAGVSLYSHFPDGGGGPAKDTYGMRQLSTTASAAWNMYQWLLRRAANLPCKLGTVRVLLSPSPAEVAATPEMQDAMPCTRAAFVRNIRAWREDALVDSKGFTLFYFAGHGVQRSPGDALILMQDFGDPDEGVVAKTVRLNDLFFGMAPSSSTLDETPLTQLYIVDACREKPTRFPATGEVSTVWDTDPPDGVDKRIAPVFAPVSGTQAFERVGEETFFSSRVMKCLDGAGGEVIEDAAGGPARWAVTVYSLSDALAYETEELKRTEGVELIWAPTGQVKNAPLHYLDGPPNVEVTLQVNPTDAVSSVHLQVLDAAGKGVYNKEPVTPHPDSQSLPAGIYRVEASVNDNRFTSFSDTRMVKPPRRCVLEARVNP